MESKNIFKNTTCNVQQVAVISKIHNMQWLKNNPPLSGHIKPKTNKGIIKVLKEDMEKSELTTESTMSVPNISTTDNLPLISTTSIVSTTNDNKYTCDTESNLGESSVVLESKESTWHIDGEATDLNQQLLILQELEQDEMMSIAIQNSLLSLEMEKQLKLEEEEKGKEQDTAKCDLTLLKIKDCISEINQKDIQDNNNNNNDNLKISQPDLKISDKPSEASLSKGADREDQSNNIYSNTETDISLNLTNPKEMSVSNDNEIIPISSMTSKSNNESKEESKCEAKPVLKKKEVMKVTTKNATPTSNSNKKNNVIVGQNTESKTKYGIKQSIKNLSAEVVRKTPDKRNHDQNQSMLNTSKVLKSKLSLQPKKETVITKHSPELSTRSTTNLKESEQNKITSLNTVSKQYRVNRMCYTSKKEESGSTSKVNNHLSKMMQHTVKRIANPNSPNLAQSTNKQSLNTSETNSDPKETLKTSDATNEWEDMQQKTMLSNNEVTKTRAFIEKCTNKSADTNKIFVNITDKETNTSSNEIKESSENSIQNFTNEHLTNEYTKPIKTNTNPFLDDVSNLATSNKLHIDTKDFKDIANTDLSIKSTQLDNIPATNIPYIYHASQQNAQQEQTLLNCIPYIPDQFIMNCSVNTALPKFPSNASYSNANSISQYGNMQTMSNVPLGAQLRNSSSPNVVPSNTGNMNALQYQMSNISTCNSQNVIRPPSNFCVHPMSQEEQFNLPAYGVNPAYFVNPVCVCRNDCLPSQPQNWNVPHNYPVILQPNPYVNYNSFCNQNVQSNNMNHKKNATARPLQSLPQAQIFHEQNLQINYGKPVSSSGYNTRNPQNYKTYDPKLQTQKTILNTRDSIDVKIEKQDGEFLSEKDVNNLPMISPKACMIYGSGLSTNVNTIRPQMKYSGTVDSVSNCHLQYQKNHEHYNNISKAHLQPNAGMGRGKIRYTHPNQPSYKAHY